MTIPNFITIFRLLLVPLIIVMIGRGQWLAAFLIFVIAGISDAVDGFIAKKFNMASELGAIIDPIADKALIVSIYVTLAIVNVLPDWLVVVVVSRDVMIVMGVIVSWVMENPIEIRPHMMGKINTLAQICLAAFILGSKALATIFVPIEIIGFIIVTLTTLASTLDYLTVWLRHMAGE